MNTSGRIKKAFANAKSQGRGAFIAYLTAGFPDAASSEAAFIALADGGVDILEIGIPFSDPFADGSVIRSAAYKAIEGGMDVEGAIALAARVRQAKQDTGIVLFSYYNPIFSMGLDAFSAKAAAAGADAVLAVDVPLEERGELVDALSAHGLSFVPLVAPNTTASRIREISSGLGDDTFIYAMTVKGVTGARAELPPELPARLDEVRAMSAPLPVAAGFGISTMEQARAVSRHADGFVVGSALVKRLAAEGRIEGELLP